MRLSSEMGIERADTLEFVEGNIAKRKVGARPVGLLRDLSGVGDQGMCGEGCRGTWEAPRLSTATAAERLSKRK